MRLIIPIFIMSRGCPHRCIFCNERITVGDQPERLTEEAFGQAIRSYLSWTRRVPDRIQIAFYGGNFTGMTRSEQVEHLAFADKFIREGSVHDVRISTRPDWIDDEILDILEEYHVRTVEIGAQSMIDEVLNCAGRGHSSADVTRAVSLLRKRRMEVGLHLMAGLPGDSPSRFARTVERAVALRPDTVRIHPTLVLAGTALAERFLCGEYVPLTTDEAIEASKYAVQMFEKAGISVIRVGLQTTPRMEVPGAVLAGPHHPAFRSLVEESIFLDMASALLRADSAAGATATFSVCPQDLSSLRGHGNRNIRILQERFGLSAIAVSVDPDRMRGNLAVTARGRTIQVRRWGVPEARDATGIAD